MLPMTLNTVEISALMPILAIMSIWWLLGMLKEILENRQVFLRKTEERFYRHVYTVRMESKLYVHLEHNRRRALSFEAFRSNIYH